MMLFCLLAVSDPAEGEQGKPTTNFTFGKKEKPAPAVRAEPVEAPKSAPAPPVVRPELVEPSVRPELVEGPVPVSPAPPAVRAEPVEPSVHPEPVEGAPVPPPETILITDEHTHPSAAGLHAHAVDFSAPLAIPAHSMVVQEVWLDPQDPPRGIALQFKRADSEEAGVYWEGEEEVFNPAEHEELWYYGMLPELGKWISLDILTEDIGLENSRITMLRFVTFDGRALWRKTVLTDAPPLEGSDQTSPAALPAPSVSTPGSSS